MKQALIEIAPEPAYNVLNSMALLNEIEQKPALDTWILGTAAALSEEQRQRNRLVFGLLHGAILEGKWHDFPAYLAALADVSAETLRDHALAKLPLHSAQAGNLEAARNLVEQPEQMRDLIMWHLRELWEQYFAVEWKRLDGPLQNQTRTMFQNRLFGARSIEENLRLLVGPELWRDSDVVTAAITRVVYVNGPHNGRYVTWLHTDSTLRVFFHAPRNFPAILRTAPVSRAELAGRLSALADETRLNILALFEHQDTLGAQDIMAQLNLTQSTVSRQLRPLLAFLNESRGKGANKQYTFSPAQQELTFQAVRDLIEQGESETVYNDARLSQPEQLRRYMNREGKLAMLPLRQADRQAALALIAEQIEPLRDYSEKEINDLIQRQIAYDDFVTIRRELYNNRYLDREPNGARYWKGARE